MKIVKLSLATVLALGTSAYAVELENIKVSGQATLYYQTLEKSDAADGTAMSKLFNKHSSFANVGLGLKFESDLGNGFGFGAKLNVLDTLGLEGELVNHVMQNVGDVADSDGVSLRDTDGDGKPDAGYDEWFFGEAYLTKKAGNTLVKVGRQELNTPLAYSEKWNVMPTTFDAAVVINSDLADKGVTLVGAYVSKSNGHGGKPQGYATPLGDFDRLGVHGAYAAGVLYSSDNLKANAWYYTVPSAADAFWTDARIKVSGVNLTAQFAGFVLENEPADKSDKNTLAGALKGSYKVNEQLNVCLAAAQTTGEKSSHQVSNVGTGGFKTKLATATITGDGDVAGATDTTSFKAKASYNLGENGSLIAQYGHYMHGEDSSVQTGNFARKADETASAAELIYKRDLLGMNVLVAYSYMDNIMQLTNAEDKAQLFRVVARYNF